MDPWRTVWLQMCVTNARNMLRFLMFIAATLSLSFCCDIAAIWKGEHDSPSDEMLHVLSERWRAKVAIFAGQQQKTSLHGPVVGYPMCTFQLLQNFSSAVFQQRTCYWKQEKVSWEIELPESRRSQCSERWHHKNHTAEVSGWWGAAATRWADGSTGSVQPGRRRDVLHAEEKWHQTTVRSLPLMYKKTFWMLM